MKSGVVYLYYFLGYHKVLIFVEPPKLEKQVKNIAAVHTNAHNFSIFQDPFSEF